MELLKFASVYNAMKLRRSCEQFIALNMAPLVEVNALKGVEYELLDGVGECYRRMVGG